MHLNWPSYEEALKAALPSATLVLSAQVPEHYARDRKTPGDMPDGVLIASNTEEIATAVRLANEHLVPVFPRGLASNSTGACVPLGGGLVIDLAKMDCLIRLDRENLLAECEPGLVTADLAKAAAAQGLFYGPDPAGWEESTLGGNVATCAGGPSCLKYGVTRDWLLSLDVVLPTGEIISTGSRSAKSVAGFDLTRLFCGSAGLLGIVTKVIVKLIPKPPKRRSLLVEFASLTKCLAGTSAIFSAGILPCALEFLDDRSIALLQQAGEFDFLPETKALLIIALDGSKEAVDADLARIVQALQPTSSRIKVAQTADEEAAVWKARTRLSPLLKTIAPGKINEDISVPRTAIGPLLEEINARADAEGLPVATFGHLGDGNLHVNMMFDPDAPSQVAAAHRVRETLMAAVLRLGGTITGEHGVGLVKRDWLERELGAVSLELQRSIKRTFDPNNILNPGKMFFPKDHGV